MAISSKANVLLVGSGGVGTMGAYALESGGLAEVTAVLRSNFSTVSEKGFDISSIDHGEVKAWKPKKIVSQVPDVSDEGVVPFDFVVVSTKNVADVSPTVVDIIAPAVTAGHTAIVLLQNGLNIEVPVIAAFPQNVVISGVSRIGAAETSHGVIVHNDRDRLHIGPFDNANLPAELQTATAQRFATMYGASGKVVVEFGATAQEVAWTRWRKLIYNACYNSIAAVTLLDSGRLRLARSPVVELLRPAMLEIVAIAKAQGHVLPLELVEEIIEAEPIEIYFKPSMQQDVEKGNYTEFENIVGEPLRTARKLGVPAPTLTVLYGILRAMQWRTKEQKGLITLESARAQLA
ncbi:2-dehydropantoate 2-reductase family [Grosmannia clavigera kw1407]|uniref:2-dehydropantoate 2-reductase n=1 Tax=Grosmannia clavigera (strain kw1407 / UAMH 11150) TaxID=655863 RepID=F0XMR9_GROCL|nr:2-dehydropantoate 2-reductase family [Grosmannia clavigera kw1407]EFX01439.1 2-dehydropantoate 2-reductase family [Grosmannia clavigera kw1407]